MPVVPATQESEARGYLEPGVLGRSVLCPLGVSIKFGINMVTILEQGTTRLPNRSDQ